MTVGKLTHRRYIQVLTRLVKKEGASTKARPKPVALFADSEAIRYYLMCCDEFSYAHPRIRPQIDFYIIIASFYGLRPSEVVESTSHRRSNEGLTYGDFTFSLVRRNGALIYHISIVLRLRKFKQDNKAKVYVIS